MVVLRQDEAVALFQAFPRFIFQPLQQIQDCKIKSLGKAREQG